MDQTGLFSPLSNSSTVLFVNTCSTDPHLVGGYKGYGLSMMVEILCGILSGSSFGLNTGNWKKGEGAVNYVSRRKNVNSEDESYSICYYI